jgi:hypothetical protein
MLCPTVKLEIFICVIHNLLSRDDDLFSKPTIKIVFGVGRAHNKAIHIREFKDLRPFLKVEMLLLVLVYSI